MVKNIRERGRGGGIFEAGWERGVKESDEAQSRGGVMRVDLEHMIFNIEPNIA